MQINNNITEDYCSFEVSKLLKEKGFEVKCEYYYMGSGKQFSATKMNHNDKSFTKEKYSSPPHALAIKWIRENFGIHICVEFCDVPTPKYFYAIYKNQNDKVDTNIERLNLKNEDYMIYDSYDQAVEAALLHVLSELI